ncbi:MAG: alpha/beta fold hydrolase [Steroidobacteraceae bacterium]
MHSLKFVGHGNLELAADGFGSPQDPPVVFWPGGGQTRRSWHRVARRLARDGFHTIAVDLRGHGDSQWAQDGDYSADALAADVVAVVSALREPPVVVGASLGGMSACSALGESSRLLLRALVLVDIVPAAEAAGIERIRAFMRSGSTGFDSPEEAAAKVSAYLPHRPPRTAAALRSSLRQGHDHRWYWHWDPAFHNGSRSGDATFLRMQEAAPNIRVPTLLVTGGASEVVTAAGARRFLDQLPDGHWAELPGATHMVAGDANSAFATAVTDFILRLPACTRAAF